MLYALSFTTHLSFCSCVTVHFVLMVHTTFLIDKYTHQHFGSLCIRTLYRNLWMGKGKWLQWLVLTCNLRNRTTGLRFIAYYRFLHIQASRSMGKSRMPQSCLDLMSYWEHISEFDSCLKNFKLRVISAHRRFNIGSIWHPSMNQMLCKFAFNMFN
jgi:hypothetical protein